MKKPGKDNQNTPQQKPGPLYEVFLKTNWGAGNKPPDPNGPRKFFIHTVSRAEAESWRKAVEARAGSPQAAKPSHDPSKPEGSPREHRPE